MTSRTRESGAVLYTALVVLILLALIGIVALQVATQQERMASNYQATLLAFQNAEGVARAQERLLEQSVLDQGTAIGLSLPPNDCLTAHDAAAWAQDEVFLRRLDLCFSWGGMDYPADESERTDQIYQITAHAGDRTLLPTSESVVDTVFIP